MFQGKWKDVEEGPKEQKCKKKTSDDDGGGVGLVVEKIRMRAVAPVV